MTPVVPPHRILSTAVRTHGRGIAGEQGAFVPVAGPLCSLPGVQRRLRGRGRDTSARAERRRTSLTVSTGSLAQPSAASSLESRSAASCVGAKNVNSPAGRPTYCTAAATQHHLRALAAIGCLCAAGGRALARATGAWQGTTVVRAARSSDRLERLVPVRQNPPIRQDCVQRRAASRGVNPRSAACAGLVQARELRQRDRCAEARGCVFRAPRARCELAPGRADTRWEGGALCQRGHRAMSLETRAIPRAPPNVICSDGKEAFSKAATACSVH